jgi:hypothetical protein
LKQRTPMETFEELQCATIQVILDYYRYTCEENAAESLTVSENKEASDATETWTQIDNQLQASSILPLAKSLLQDPPLQRDAYLDTYIHKATETNNTRTLLLMQLKKILSIIDDCINAHFVNANLFTLNSPKEKLTTYLKDIQANIPARGNAKRALETFFDTLKIDIPASHKNIYNHVHQLFVINALHNKVQALEAAIQTNAENNQRNQSQMIALLSQNKRLQQTIQTYEDSDAEPDEGFGEGVNDPSLTARFFAPLA